MVVGLGIKDQTSGTAQAIRMHNLPKYVLIKTNSVIQIPTIYANSDKTKILGKT